MCVAHRGLGGPTVSRPRRLAALSAAALAASATVIGATIAAPHAHAQSTLPDPAVQSFGACLNGQRAGDLLVLIDVSGSLATTDPQGARITAARYLIEQMDSLGARSEIALDVGVAAFASEFTLTTDWTPLGPDTTSSVLAGIDSFRDRDTGFDTDYWMAMEGARRALSERDSSGEARRCQAIAWFSDGQLDIESRDTGAKAAEHGTTRPYAPGIDITSEAGATAAEQAATAEICREGGLADQVRSAGTVTFAIGLAAAGTPSPDFGLMRSIATGHGDGGATCGKPQEPEPGTFQLASDIDDLLFAFDAIIPPDAQTSCPAGDAGCRHTFVLDGSIDGVHLIATVDRPGLRAELTSPTGAVAVLEPGQEGRADPGGIAADYSWQSDRTVAVDLDRPASAAGWTGVWSLRFVDPSGATPGESRSNVHIWGDLVPVWTHRTDTPLASGSIVPDVQFDIERTDGTRVGASDVAGELTLDAVLVTADGTDFPVASGLGKADLGRPVTLDLTDVQPGSVLLRMTLSLTTAPATDATTGSTVKGTTLAPQRVDLPLEVRPPLGYPTLPARITFGPGAEGDTTLTARIPVTGPGCVWVEATPGINTTPAGVEPITIGAGPATSSQTCLQVEEGRTGELTLEMTVGKAGNGTVSGTLPIATAPLDEPDAVRVVEVPFSADLRTALNPGVFLAALIGMMALGVGIPLLVAWLLKRAATRIPRGGGLYAARIPVQLRDGRALRDGAPFWLRDADFVQLVPIPERGARRIPDLHGVTLRARTGLSPFGTGHVQVDSGIPAASSTDPEPRGDDLHARLPLAVQNKWVVLHDPSGQGDRAEVLVLLGAQTPQGERDRIASDIGENLPAVAGRIRAAGAASGRRPASPPGSEPPPDPFGGGVPGATYGRPTVPTPTGPGPGGYGQGGGWGPPPGGASPPGHDPFDRR
jgi:hypothetical protein